jgi:hypothetical protein
MLLRKLAEIVEPEARAVPMPDSEDAMRAHMMAPPPDGHGMEDMPADMAMGDMTARHDRAHSDGAGHTHTGPRSLAAEDSGALDKWRARVEEIAAVPAELPVVH